MTLSGPAILALAAQCAPNVAPATVAAIVATESRGRPFALNVNGAGQPSQPRSVSEAVATAKRYIAAGHSVDLGLGQINSRNMRKLGLSWSNVFDPCTNIAALGRILTQNFEAAGKDRAPQDALRIALSLYNTGSPSRGFRNGYVAKVIRNAGKADIPPLADAKRAAEPTVAPSADRPIATEAPPAALAAPPGWDLFARASFDREALSMSRTGGRKSVWAE